MKKITLLFLLLTISFSVHAQFPEGFEGGVPPTNWASFRGTNDLGTAQDWKVSTTSASGSQAAYVSYENVSGGNAEDWLVTAQFTPTAATNILTFKQRQAFSSDYGTTYTIRVSTASQTTHADFTTIDTQSESDFGLVYSTHNVDLSAYNGMPIYVAFVMDQDDGDSWYVDDVDLIANANPPNCATSPSPADGATDVAVNSNNVTISWSAPTTGDAPTDYEVFWGETSGSLTSLGSISATTVDITNVDKSKTYYWMIVPKNVGGSATGCPEWSFTTEDPPPPPANDTLAGAIPITPSAQGTGCTQAGFTLNFSTDGTTDSGLDNTCNNTDTGLDQFFTWTATTTGLLWNDAAPGNPGITIRDTSGNEITCAGTFAGDDTILTGWNIGDELIIQIYDYGTSVSDVAFCLELYTPPAPIVPTDYTADFSTYPQDRWSEATGAFMMPSGSSSSFAQDDFGNDTGHANGKSARVNIYGTGTDEYLLSPEFNLSAGTYYLNFDFALTEFSGTAQANLGADDFVALIVTEDEGSNWTELLRWDSTSTISNTGDAITEMTLTGYGNKVQFAFYAFSDTSNEDNNFYIDNFRITSTALGISKNTLENFKLFPTVVKDEISFTSQKIIDNFEVYNLIGQKVFSKKVNLNSANFNLSTLKRGVYIVKVKSGDSIGSYKIIKE